MSQYNLLTFKEFRPVKNLHKLKCSRKEKGRKTHALVIQHLTTRHLTFTWMAKGKSLVILYVLSTCFIYHMPYEEMYEVLAKISENLW